MINNKALFVSEDGVDIFEGDFAHWVRMDKLMYLYYIKTAIAHKRTLSVEGNIYAVFSTKEKAEEWIRKMENNDWSNNYKNEQNIAYLEGENHYLNNVVIPDLEDKLNAALYRLYELTSLVNLTINGHDEIYNKLSTILEDNFTFLNHVNYKKIINLNDIDINNDLPF